MAYTSFKLRNTIANGGSALRRTNVDQNGANPGGSGTAVYDSGLRSDGFIVPVPPEYLESTFSADVFERGQIELRWELGTALVSAPATLDFEPVELVIRASQYGEPVTVGDGIFVVSTTYDGYIENYIDVAGPSRPYIGEGKWAYYSVFIKYQNSADEAFYEKVADVSVQTPYDFNSTASLWERIPLYYRQLDQNFVDTVQEYSEQNGPLYRYVDLFGWELDKIRTTIYDTMRISDPDVIHSSAIDALASQTGVEFSKNALGTGKLRNVLNNIGYLRRAKGTKSSVMSYISALTGCGVTYASNTNSFNVHPMRANLLSDPLFAQASTNSDVDLVSGDSIRVTRLFADLNTGGVEHGWGLYITNDPSDPVPMVSVSNGTITIDVTGSSFDTQIMVYGRKSFTYNNDLVYYGSAEVAGQLFEGTFSLRFITPEQRDAIEIDPTPPPGMWPDFYDFWNNSPGLPDPHYRPTFPEFSHPTRRVVGSVPYPLYDTFGLPSLIVVPMFYMRTSDNVITFKEPMVEYSNSSGDFFTGNTPGGGFLPDSTGSLNEGIYDYHWGESANGTANADFSYYTIDFQRSKEVTEYVVNNYIVPVTYGTATINWDVLE